MDIVKQIMILSWVLLVAIITPPVLRYFHLDVKNVYRKVLAVDNSSLSSQRDGLLAHKEVRSDVFEELFNEPETSQERLTAKEEFEKMIDGLRHADAAEAATENQIQEVPSVFRYDTNAQNKVLWLPPPPGFTTAETFNYLIYRQDQPVGEQMKTVLDDIHGNLMLDLTPFTLVAKPHKILVMLFDNKDSYMSFTKRPAWSGAASDLQADTMYVLEGKSFYPLSVHELTHLYFDGYFLPSISPLWLSEGMAVYMQMYVSRRKPSWINQGLASILSGQSIPLEEMMQMKDLSSLNTQQAELWYTQAFSIVDYLLNSHSRDEFYRFCNELKAGAPVYQALYRAYGMPFNKVSVLQNVWLHDLQKKMGRSFAQLNAPAQSSTAPATAAAKPAQPRTVIPKLKLVETNGYKGYF